MSDNLELTKAELEEMKKKWKEEVKEEIKEQLIDNNFSEKSFKSEMSRRHFLKKLSAGAIGLGALGLTPASSLNFRSENLRFYGGEGETSVDFEVDKNGNISLPNGNLQIATGYSITDGSGAVRLDFQDGKTSLVSQNSSFYALNVDETRGGYIGKYGKDNGTIVFDENGGYTALSYRGSSNSPGTLELTNSDFDANGYDVSGVAAFETSGADINGDYVWASNFNGSSPDERLSNSISAVESGTVIYLENETYSQDLTINKAIKLVGTGTPSNGTQLNQAIWTADDFVTFKNLDLQGGDLIINGGAVPNTGERYYGRVIGCYVNSPNGEDPVNIEINCNRAIISRIDGSGANINFSSGTSEGVVDTITGNISVVDNGNNKLGGV